MRKLHHLEVSELDSTSTIFHGGTLHAIDPESEGAEAFLVYGTRFGAVGSLDDCRTAAAELSSRPPREIDLAGLTVVPGFIDAHAHPLMYGQMMSWVDCGPDKAGTIPHIIALLKDAAATLPEHLPIRGYGYEHRNLAEGRHPLKEELDQVSTTREVYLMNASGHGGVVNSFTFDKYGITRDTPNPTGGEFFKNADGDLTGEISDAACNILTGIAGVKVGHHGPNFHLEDEPEEHLRQLRTAQEKFLAGGVTTIGDCQVTRRELDMYLQLSATGQLKTRVSMYLLSHLLDHAIDTGLHGAFGNSHLSFAGIKFYADGTLGGWTAYFPDGYVGDPCRTGQLYHDPADYADLIMKAHAVGLQTATHAQSPDALAMVLDAIERAQEAHPAADARHRIEHCGLPTPDQIDRIKRLGVHPVNQPQHYYNWGEGVTAAIGTPGERFNPLGEFISAGVPVTISSDAPVAAPKPLEAIQAAVTRVTRNGHQLGSDSLRITAAEALEAHTLNGALTLGREDELGSISTGKRADFVVLGEDPLTVSPDCIAAIPVHETWVDGRQHYSSSDA